MKHTLHLKSSPFEKIQNKTKTIELRLYDEKRKQIQVGDIIEFIQLDNPNHRLEAKVTGLYVFDSFEQLYKSLPLTECGYTIDTVKDADPKDMEAYYPKEKQKQYGVVGIQIEVLQE